MNIIGGPVEGVVVNRMTGTKVKLAGKTMYLPNSENTYIRQKLTVDQIAAIPTAVMRDSLSGHSIIMRTNVRM